MLEFKYNVHTRLPAEERFIEHVEFLAQKDIPAANRLAVKLCDGIDSLDFNPQRCPRYFSPQKGLDDAMFRYCLCAKRHRIVFEVVDDVVYIQDVQDCRQHTNKSLV